MTKMRTRAMVAAMVTMSVLAAGCGTKTAEAPKNDMVMESVMETVEETMEASTEETVEETKGIVKETTKAVESVVRKTETTKAAKTETVKSETKAETKAAKKEIKAETKAETKAAAKKETEAPKKAETPKKETAAPAPKVEAKPVEKPAAAPTEAPKPAHQHVWKNHKAVRQEWVSNIVSVPDYEVQSVKVGFNTICNCGAVNPSQDHLDNHILNGEDSGYWYEDIYEDQKVQVGSHDEDQGYYKDVEYVDYQYCDCGAKK